MFKQLVAVSVVALCVGTGVAAAQSTTQVPLQIGDTYIWHGEFVSFDEGAKTLTVKAEVLTETEKDLGRFKAGDRVLLTWSGMDRYAGALRSVTAYAAGQKIAEPFSLVAELTSPVVQASLVTLRLQVPEAKADAVGSIKAGEWVTMTARQRPATEAQAVVAIDRYVKSIAEGTN